MTAIAGGAYGFSRAAAGNLRKKDDAINTAIGGFLAGSILGMTSMYSLKPARQGGSEC
jgi:hypothetical protein